ncbi:HAD-IA family hydrolase [Roseomonas sp. NAR14]|uniref:HAD-IA family hydrolase n=1 Tax=Roseomonas acroporae TaxID=2937791 RepID=A0A9X1Y713_9PROT|nr:HAD-IA family hydrolase [Roseomonas acroporae]MCK8784701.1 HAD-IA family hydrolase [Roseomonas acroporae]
MPRPRAGDVRGPLAVLFDCDGVLADSEGLVNRLVAEELTGRGWAMDGNEARRLFLGLALPEMIPIVEARTGALPPDWGAALGGRIARALLERVEPMPGAPEAVRAVVMAGLPAAVASNSSRAELAAKMARLGLGPCFGPRVFSFEDVPAPKPAPDLYRAAAAACGAPPGRCVVVEDSVVGVRAGVAAGCRVLGLAAETPAAALRAAGAEVFGSMRELPGLLGLAG